MSSAPANNQLRGIVIQRTSFSRRGFRRSIVGAVSSLAVVATMALSQPAGAFVGSPPSQQGSPTGWSVHSIGTSLATPIATALDHHGHLYVASNSATSVTVMNTDGTNQHTVGSALVEPYGIALDNAGHILVSDFTTGVLTEMNLDGSHAFALASGYVSICQVAVDGLGHVFFTLYSQSLVMRMNADGSDQHAIGTGFSGPVGIFADHAGHVYVADTENSRIVRMNADGTKEISLGSGFNRPEGVAVDSSGNIFVGDYGNNRVAEMDAAGNNVRTIGSGVHSSEGVTLSPSGTVYAQNSSQIVVIQPDPSAVPVSNGAQVSWSSPFNDGAPYQYFTVTAHPQNGPDVEQTVPASSHSTTMFGLQNGVSYYFTVTATNQFGTSVDSAASSVIVPGPSFPNAPTALSVKAHNNSVTASWHGPNANGSGIVGYRLVATAPSQFQVATTFPASVTSGTMGALHDGTTYSFSVQAINAVGVSDASASVNAEPVGPPSWPTPSAVFVSAGVKKAVVSWLAAVPNGFAVTKYVVTSSPGAKSCSTKGALSCTVSALSAHKNYVFTVVATNKLGVSVSIKSSSTKIN